LLQKTNPDVGQSWPSFRNEYSVGDEHLRSDSDKIFAVDDEFGL